MATATNQGLFIITPDFVVPEANVSISWNYDGDYEIYGSPHSYLLTKRINGAGNWTTIYSGVSWSYNDPAVSADNTIIQYTLQAYFDSATLSVTSYIVTVTNPPTVPSSITVPSTINPGATVIITWGTSTDPEGALSGYKLERQINSGSWSQRYSGTTRSYNDTIPSTGTTAVTYRVRAFDALGAHSDYRTSPTRTVIANSAPTITPSNTNIGAQTGAFMQNYTATDADAGAVITVVETIDSVQKRSYTAVSGVEQTFTVTTDDFIKLSNDTHRLYVVATDQYGATSSTRTYTFTKNETQIDVKLATPLNADAMPERIIMTISGEIPNDAILQILVCNNANDASPTWEDATGTLSSGYVYHFTNETKTAPDWGVNFNVKVDRNGATGNCNIIGIGGNFA